MDWCSLAILLHQPDALIPLATYTVTQHTIYTQVPTEYIVSHVKGDSEILSSIYRIVPIVSYLRILVSYLSYRSRRPKSRSRDHQQGLAYIIASNS